ncbi:hypothetical protein O3G_MSEX012969 [Manduca sexta]|uniref:Uncharacterized protein n=1 Tax=Manduca sexta TaxID=7130 RepID=A0A921ZR89_MANSE|nr:hypothetical protein O3G_MSEX012969 [Manduca sexta]
MYVKNSRNSPTQDKSSSSVLPLEISHDDVARRLSVTRVLFQGGTRWQLAFLSDYTQPLDDVCVTMSWVMDGYIKPQFTNTLHLLYLSCLPRPDINESINKVLSGLDLGELRSGHLKIMYISK